MGCSPINQDVLRLEVGWYEDNTPPGNSANPAVLWSLYSLFHSISVICSWFTCRLVEVFTLE
jgi:hypothetical protein